MWWPQYFTSTKHNLFPTRCLVSHTRKESFSNDHHETLTEDGPNEDSSSNPLSPACNRLSYRRLAGVKALCWLVILGFNATLTAQVIIMAVGDAHVFPGFLTPVLTQLFFPKPPTTFLKCFCRGERRKYARKKSRLNRGSNSQSPGHESGKLYVNLPQGQKHNYINLTPSQKTNFRLYQTERVHRQEFQI